MMLDLTNEETDALARLLSRTIDDDRYPLSPRIQILKDILVSNDLTLETSCRDFSFMRAPG
jgi:hypothetical protein